MSLFSKIHIRDLKLFAIAFLLACGFWYMLVGSAQVEGQVDLRVEYRNLPEEYIIQDEWLDTLSVRVRGSTELLRRLREKNLVYTVDLSNIEEGANVFAINLASNTELRTFEIVNITPSSLVIEADEKMTRTIPVEVEFTGSMQPDIVISDIHLEPSEIEVVGIASVLDKIEAFKVEFNLDQVYEAGEYSRSLSLTIPKGVKASSPVSTLSFNVYADIEFVNLTRLVQVSSPKLQGAIEPKTVELRISIPASIAENEKEYAETMAKVRVVLREPTMIFEGQKIPVEVELPAKVQLIEVSPRDIKVKEIQ